MNHENILQFLNHLNILQSFNRTNRLNDWHILQPFELFALLEDTSTLSIMRRFFNRNILSDLVIHQATFKEVHNLQTYLKLAVVLVVPVCELLLQIVHMCNEL